MIGRAELAHWRIGREGDGPSICKGEAAGTPPQCQRDLGRPVHDSTLHFRLGIILENTQVALWQPPQNSGPFSFLVFLSKMFCFLYENAYKHTLHSFWRSRNM